VVGLHWSDVVTPSVSARRVTQLPYSNSTTNLFAEGETMTKPMPHLSQEVIDLSWETSQASNRAFDTLREAEASITEVQKVAKTVEGGELTYEAIAPLEKIRNDAQANFHLLTQMATPVMSLSKSPFAPNSIEATTVLATQSVAKVTERSEDLPVDYRERLVTRYVQKREAVVRQVADGALPENYQLPELSDLLKRAVSLATTYEVMVENGWEPDVVFGVLRHECGFRDGVIGRFSLQDMGFKGRWTAR
jgi:hypothetical protein